MHWSGSKKRGPPGIVGHGTETVTAFMSSSARACEGSEVAVVQARAPSKAQGAKPGEPCSGEYVLVRQRFGCPQPN